MNTIINSNHNDSYIEQEENMKTTTRVFIKFLQTYEETHLEEEKKITKPYHEEAFKMMNSKRTTMYINFYHLINYNNFDLIQAIHEEFYKYENSLKSAVYKFIEELYPEYARQKVFYISFYNFHEVDLIRSLKTEKLGKLISFNGTITKTTEVRPELLIGNFLCEVCGQKFGLKEQQFKFTLPNYCPNKNCNNQTKFELVNEGSIFVDWQKIKVQESSGDMPSGSMPRSIDVILRHDQVEKAQPGDRVVITGTLIVVPDIFSMIKPGEKYELSNLSENVRTREGMNRDGVSGLKSLGLRDISYKLIFLSNNIRVNEIRFSKESENVNFLEQNEDDYLASLNDQDKSEIEKMRNLPDLFNKMANIICPSVLGNTQIKKGILLMLFSGVNKKTKDSMKIRGDINICIVGDPSTAKSQFLKFVHNYIPRTIYTSGRGSSSAGLTASLVKDPETGEFTLEAGALMLADNGICCIDEFDKMQDKDVVAIHEAMEQQTISITKAGIQATLNARCSILAAMNPILGRYVKTKNLKYNVNLSPPLMSRFDIFFVLTDECNQTVDTAIARMIVGMHKNSKKELKIEENIIENILTHKSLLRYLKFARHVNPQITEEAAKLLSIIYQRMRMNEFSLQRNAYRITVRQLESLIRLSEACARLHCSFQVTTDHVREAVNLLNQSIIKIEAHDFELEDTGDIILNREEKGKENKDMVKGKEEMEIEEEKKEEEKKSDVRKRLIVKSDDFQRICKGLQFILRKSPDRSMVLDELVLVFMDSELSAINSMNEMNYFEKMVRAIVTRMVKKEKIFVLFLNAKEEKIIKFHPSVNRIN